MREPAIWLQDHFIIRIYNRDPGPHILAKQRLVGTNSEPFSFSRFCAMAVVTRFSAATVCFFNFEHRLTVFKSFIFFSNFFASKTNLSDAPKQSSKFGQLKPHGTAAPSQCLSTIITTEASSGDFSHMVIPTRIPTSSGNKSAPLSSSRLRPEAVATALHIFTIHPVYIQYMYTNSTVCIHRAVY